MQKFFDFLSRMLATGFFIGYFLPTFRASGAAFVFLFTVPYFLRLNFLWQISLLLMLTIIGVLTSSRAETLFNTKDDKRIVIDEIVSIYLSFLFLENIPLWIFAVIFILNRFLDFWKPFGISRLQKLPKGIGIMADDLAVGILCWPIAFFLLNFFR